MQGTNRVGKGRGAKGAARAAMIGRTMRRLEQLRQEALAIEAEFAPAMRRVAPGARASARNLLHYLAVRRNDIRDLQRDLSRLGLSSLGRMEAHVMASINTVLDVLARLSGNHGDVMPEQADVVGFDAGNALLAHNARASLGALPGSRNALIMVTLPTEAASEPELVRDLLAGGMDIARINCAHDDERVWRRMIRNLRAAEKELGRTCRISFDLAGPKLRTGPVAAGPGVVKWRTGKDAYGRIIRPAGVLLRSVAATEPGDAVPVSAELMAVARAADVLKFLDVRGRKRQLVVTGRGRGVLRCDCAANAYVTAGTVLKLYRNEHLVAKGRVGALPAREGEILLKPGDVLEMMLGDMPGNPAVVGPSGRVLETARVSCALEEVFHSVKAGDPVLFDDGKISGRITQVLRGRVCIEITRCARQLAKLRGGKGINLPATELPLRALTAKDRADLRFIARHGDLVAMSFVQCPEDVTQLIRELQRLDAAHVGIILKIETRQAFSRLPELLLRAMSRPPVAVMVARGDLGVQLGFERLSEVQEEILWLCEASHMPVIWATQVLESLARGGMPSRAEVTDAAMSSRAECVMLNKGPYIRETLRFLCDVLNRMRAHHEKKTSMLRRLSVSEGFVPPAAAAGRAIRS